MVSGPPPKERFTKAEDLMPLWPHPAQPHSCPIFQKKTHSSRKPSLTAASLSLAQQ